jgi:hypothetical protein
MCWLLVCWSLVSHFYVWIDFSEKEFNWKASCKTIRKWWFCNPLKTYQSLVEKLFGPMSFEEKIMGGNKISNVLIILEAKLRLMSQFSIKVNIGNTPPNHCLMMMGHCQNPFFGPRPNNIPDYCWKTAISATCITRWSLRLKIFFLLLFFVFLRWKEEEVSVRFNSI